MPRTAPALGGRVPSIAGRLGRGVATLARLTSEPCTWVRMVRDPRFHSARALASLYPVRSARQLSIVGGGVLALGALAAIELPHGTLAVASALVAGTLTVVGVRVWHGPAGLRRRGLPPGRLSVIPSAQLDPDHYAAGCARYGPVHATNTYYTATVAVQGLDRGADVLRTHQDALEPLRFPHTLRVPGGAVRHQTGDRHRASRTTLARALSPATVAAARPQLAAAVGRHLDSWVHDGRDLPPTARVADLVLDAWIVVLLGVDPRSDPERHERLRTLIGPYLHADPTTFDDAADAEALALVIDAARDPGALAPSAVRTLAQSAPDALDDPVVTGNLLHVLQTSRRDVSGLLTWVAVELARQPAWHRRVAGADGELVAAQIVSETLRLHQSEFVTRRTTREIEIEGHRVPAGWFLRVLVAESHRDPAHFPDPQVFNPDRFAAGRPPRNRYEPFGLDGHACVGEGLARATAVEFVLGLAQYELELTGDGPVSPDVDHHWAPAQTVRIRLRRPG